MSFSVTLENASFFKRIINAMEMLDEPIIRVRESGLLVRQMDVSRSSMIHFEVPKSVFAQYEWEKDDMVQVDRSDLLRCLRRAKEDQYIGLSVTEDKRDKLVVTLSEKSVKDFTIPIFTVEEKNVNPPPPVRKALFDVKIKMDASAIADTIDEFISVFSKDIEGRIDFTATEGHLIIEATGARRGLTVTHMLDADILAMEVPDEKVSSSYGVTLLNEIVTPSANLSGVVLIEFAKEMPIRLTYELPFEGTLLYYLAPRVKVVEIE